MTSMRRFSVFDLLRFNNVNLDPLTETYNMGFYLQYIAKWPEYCFVADGPTGRSMGYVLGKAEDFQDKPDSWHGHVTAVTVPPEYRRLGMATQLMHVLERGSRTNSQPSHAPNLTLRPAPPRSFGAQPRLLRRPLRSQVERARDRHVLQDGVHGVQGGDRLLLGGGECVRYEEATLARPGGQVGDTAAGAGVPA